MITMLRLLRQDPAVPVLFRVMPVAVIAGLVLRMEPKLVGNLDAVAAGRPPAGFAPLVMLLSLMFVIFVAGSNSWTHASRLSLLLPLSSRRVWVARVVAISMTGVLPVAALALVMAVRFGPDGGWWIEPVALAVGARVAAAIVVVALIFQSPSPELQRITVDAEYVVLCVVAGLGVMALSLVEMASMVGTGLFLAVALALGIRLYRALPESFAVAPAGAEGVERSLPSPDDRTAAGDGSVGAVASPAETSPAGWRFQVRLSLVIARVVSHNLLSWLFLAMFLFTSFAAVVEYGNGGNAVFPVALVVIWHLPIVQTAFARLDRLDPLPISRRLLFAHMVGPAVLAVAGGAVCGRVAVLLSPDPQSHVRLERGTVHVPAEHLAVAPDGRVPTVVAPWGESLTPRGTPIAPGWSAVIYNPYDVGPGSSARFVELQLERAADSVYGPDRPATARGAVVSAGPGAEGGACCPAPPWAGLRSDCRSRLAAVGLLLATVLGAVLVATSGARWSPRVNPAVITWVGVGALALCGTVALIVVAAAGMGMAEPRVVPALVAMAIRRVADRAPLSTPALWLLTPVVMVGACLILERVFRHLECPGRRIIKPFAEEY